MRRLLTFPCDGRALGATLDEADGATGLIMVNGGRQTRIGSHRMFERLAAALAQAGYPCLRFDRRGVGDSEGDDPGYRASAPDLAAAVAAFRAECPGLERVAGFGLCDGATALLLFGAEAGFDALLLANPWFVEVEENAPAAPAVRRYYRDRLFSSEGWRRVATGRVSYGRALRGLGRLLGSAQPSELVDSVVDALAEAPPATLIVSRSDATGATAEALWHARDFANARARHPEPIAIASDSHTFAKRGDDDALVAACLTALDRVGESG